ncbi:MAG: hypothetical protein RJA36_3542, partial [Pseudomonadota bacterium]
MTLRLDKLFVRHVGLHASELRL